MSAREIVDTAARLDYVYDDEPAGAIGAAGFAGAAAGLGVTEAFAAASASSAASSDAEEPTLIGSTGG